MRTGDQPALSEDLLIVPCLLIVNEQYFLVGINAQKILAVVDNIGMTPLPASHYPFIGLQEYQNQAIPVMNLTSVLEQPPQSSQFSTLPNTKSSENSENTENIQSAAQQMKIVFCQLCNLVVGLAVNATYRIEPIKNSDVLVVPKIFEQHNGCMFNGLIHYKGRFLYLLDLEGILESLGLLKINEYNETKISEKKGLLKNKTVLMVEDSKIFRNQLSKLLAANQINYVEANNGAEGLKYFLATPEKFDLVLTDLEMPIMNGLEMARKIRESGSTIPLLFNSSISNPTLIAEIKAEHGCFIVKFQPDEIMNEISSILGG